MRSIFLKLSANFGKWVRLLTGSDTLSVREFIGQKYLRGSGIEVGALHSPLKIPKSAKVTYVDRMSVADLLKHYPELRSHKLVEVGIIDDGEILGTIPDESQDFVIANHFLEHCGNPLFTLRNFLRVLKNDGVCLITVPDKRFTFDKERPVTPFTHLLEDFKKGPEGSRKAHYLEWVSMVDKVRNSADAEKKAAQLMEMDYSIHYHVWTEWEVFEMILGLRSELGLSFDCELLFRNRDEVLFVLSKKQKD